MSEDFLLVISALERWSGGEIVCGKVCCHVQKQRSGQLYKKKRAGELYHESGESFTMQVVCQDFVLPSSREWVSRWRTTSLAQQSIDPGMLSKQIASLLPFLCLIGV
jgi:hypothetical protein